jgi:serine/threonine-protein kinase
LRHVKPKKSAVSRFVEAEQTPQPAGYRVDDLIIDLGRQRVTRGNEGIPLPGLSFDLLLALVRAAPNLLSNEQLMERVWPRLVVNSETVSQRVMLVRNALGDDPHTPRYIAGVRGRGYRVLPPVILLASPRALAAGLALHGTEPPPAPAIPEAERTLPAVPKAGWRKTASAVGAAALLIAGAAAVVSQMRDREKAQPATTIAVMPFVNIGSDPENEYLSDGLTDELLNRLTRAPELQVAARTSSFYFKSRPENVKEIGRLLGVRHVLEGSVRRQGDSIRVSAQLVSTADGYRLWSNEYDRGIADFFVVQEEIAQAVVESLQLGQTARAFQLPPNRSTRNPEAHDLYLRARHLYQSFQLERMDRAIAYYEETIRLDPKFAAAYVGLADALGWRGQIAEMPHADPVNARISVLLRKALELDPGSGDAHALLGTELMFAYDFKGAERELRRAETLTPNGEYVVQSVMAYYMLVGWPPERAITYARKGRQLDPFNPWMVIHVAQAHWHAQQYDDALIELERVFEIDPDFWLAHIWQSMILTDLNRPREALAAARRAAELNELADTLNRLAMAHLDVGETTEARKVIARLEARGASMGAGLCLALKDRECALTSLERSYAQRDRWLPDYLHYKELLPLHGEPRFQRLVRLLGQERRVEQTARVNRTVAAVR